MPANANSNQRFMTVDAFRRAGFSVLGLLNEPSAASIEFGHRSKSAGRVLVYDLGGGTFDVSLVDLGAREHTVLATEGIATLGGDEFDQILAEMAVGEVVMSEMDAGELFRLHDECRRHKEALHPNSRRMVIDLDSVHEGLGQATVMWWLIITSSAGRWWIAPWPPRHAWRKAAEKVWVRSTPCTSPGGGSELPLVALCVKSSNAR